jgi:hypothetical protein
MRCSPAPTRLLLILGVLLADRLQHPAAARRAGCHRPAARPAAGLLTGGPLFLAPGRAAATAAGWTGDTPMRATELLLLSSPLGQAMAEIVSDADGARLTGDGQNANGRQRRRTAAVGAWLPLAPGANWPTGYAAGVRRAAQWPSTPGPSAAPAIRRLAHRLRVRQRRATGPAWPPLRRTRGRFELRLRIDEWLPLPPRGAPLSPRPRAERWPAARLRHGTVGSQIWNWQSVYPAPAKLNLFLHVVGRRADGYHLLQTVFRFLDHGDRLRFAPRSDGAMNLADAGARSAGGERPDRSRRPPAAGGRRLADRGRDQHREAPAARRRPRRRQFGCGDGPAGAQPSLATWLAPPRCRTIGLQLGADVPVFVFGRNAFAEGVGETLHAVDLPPRWYLVLEPPLQVPRRPFSGPRN